MLRASPALVQQPLPQAGADLGPAAHAHAHARAAPTPRKRRPLLPQQPTRCANAAHDAAVPSDTGHGGAAHGPQLPALRANAALEQLPPLQADEEKSRQTQDPNASFCLRFRLNSIEPTPERLPLQPQQPSGLLPLQPQQQMLRAYAALEQQPPRQAVAGLGVAAHAHAHARAVPAPRSRLPLQPQQPRLRATAAHDAAALGGTDHGGAAHGAAGASTPARAGPAARQPHRLPAVAALRAEGARLAAARAVNTSYCWDRARIRADTDAALAGGLAGVLAGARGLRPTKPHVPLLLLIFAASPELHQLVSVLGGLRLRLHGDFVPCADKPFSKAYQRYTAAVNAALAKDHAAGNVVLLDNRVQALLKRLRAHTSPLGLVMPNGWRKARLTFNASHGDSGRYFGSLNWAMSQCEAPSFPDASVDGVAVLAQIVLSVLDAYPGCTPHIATSDVSSAFNNIPLSDELALLAAARLLDPDCPVGALPAATAITVQGNFGMAAMPAAFRVCTEHARRLAHHPDTEWWRRPWHLVRAPAVAPPVAPLRRSLRQREAVDDRDSQSTARATPPPRTAAWLAIYVDDAAAVGKDFAQTTVRMRSWNRAVEAVLDPLASNAVHGLVGAAGADDFSPAVSAAKLTPPATTAIFLGWEFDCAAMPPVMRLSRRGWTKVVHVLHNVLDAPDVAFADLRSAVGTLQHYTAARPRTAVFLNGFRAGLHASGPNGRVQMRNAISDRRWWLSFIDAAHCNQDLVEMPLAHVVDDPRAEYTMATDASGDGGGGWMATGHGIDGVLYSWAWPWSDEDRAASAAATPDQPYCINELELAAHLVVALELPECTNNSTVLALLDNQVSIAWCERHRGRSRGSAQMLQALATTSIQRRQRHFYKYLSSSANVVADGASRFAFLQSHQAQAEYAALLPTHAPASALHPRQPRPSTLALVRLLLAGQGDGALQDLWQHGCAEFHIG